MTSSGVADAYEHLKQAQRSLNALLQERFATDLDPELADALASIARAQDRLLEARERSARWSVLGKGREVTRAGTQNE